MTWHAAEMPDDALDPNSLVGRMLRPSVDDVTWDSPKEVKLIGGRITDAEGEPIMEISFDPEPTPLPLWRVMEQAYFNGRNPGCADHLGYAAEIEALRDWLLRPDEAEPVCGQYSLQMGHYKERQRLRDLLTEQARIARGGSNLNPPMLC